MSIRHLSTGWGWVREHVCCDGCGLDIAAFEPEPAVIARFDSHDDEEVIESFTSIYCGSDCVDAAGLTHPRVPAFVREWHGEFATDDDWAADVTDGCPVAF